MACDLVGFFRPRLSGCVGKHYQSTADKALPAIVLAVVAAVGSVGKVRLPLLRLLLRAEPGDRSEAALQRRAITQAGAALHPDEVLVVDAGFGVAALLHRGRPALCGAGGAQLYGPPQRSARLQRPGASLSVWGAGTPLAPHPQRQDYCRHTLGCHCPVGGGRAADTGPSLGQPGALHRQAWRRSVSVCGDPRPALPGTAG